MKSIQPQNVISTLEKSILVDGFHKVIDLEKSQGSYIIDAITGKKTLDCYTYFASLPIGHNHPKMADPTFQKKLMTAALSNPANSDIYSKELAQSVDTFARLAKPEYMNHLFFVAGGALAVENCCKAAIDWKVQKNFQKGYNTEKGHQIMHLKQAFHGRSGYTMSLTNTDPIKTQYFPKFDWPRINNPKLNFPINNAVITNVKKQEEKSLEEIHQSLKTNKDDIAGIIIEPIQGEGGDNHFRPEFIQSLEQVCNENEMLLMVDEIQTGMGTTGKMWAHQYHKVKPDLLAFGKKAQVCGIMGGPKLDQIENNVFKKSSRINSTWGGNLVDLVRGARYLEIIHEDNLIENAKTVGEYFLQELNNKISDNDKITNIRGQGTFIAFDAKNPQARNELWQKTWDNNLAMLTCGEKSIRFRPALTFSKEDVDTAIKILQKTIHN
ncbi:L-lysine 6-transaminase [archaeon]|jgi:L-lysine 6-transaminase|nr:L-lysine 6-transaminase [archaeon]MBT7128302.1 L-lysine 6-transaminase [archaeon]